MPRPDEGIIHAWLDGELDAAEAARVEALVRDDLEWAAAAAEARGLTAASARIVGALDHVPANVIPKTSGGERVAAGGGTRVTPGAGGIGVGGRRVPWWTMRVAALLVVAVGTALVVSRSPEDFAIPASETVKTLADADAAPPALATDAPGAVSAGTEGSGRARQAGKLADDKALDGTVSGPLKATVPAAAPTRDEKDALGRAANAPPSAAMGSRAAQPAPPAPPSNEETRRDRPAAGAGALGAASAASAAGERIQEITIRPVQQCFREASVSAAGSFTIHRVDRASDSTALFASVLNAPSPARSLRENAAAPQMTVRGDTLFVGTAPDGRRRIALRVICPAP